MSIINQSQEVISRISGATIERGLIDLAQIGGTPIDATPEQAERYAPNRLALTAADHAGRQHIYGLMQEAGLQPNELHPLALVGALTGADPSLAPVTILSHYDTVPAADMYDGVLGVIGGITVLRAIQDSDIQPRRGIQVLALTGEESSRFKFALFGSRAVFSGLADEELLAADSDGTRIMDELDDDEIVAVQTPLFGEEPWELPVPHAAIELHVEQGSRLQELACDLGVVEAIAAPMRHMVSIGDVAVAAEASPLPHRQYLELVVQGRSDHSGATPMGSEHRADGLLETAKVLAPFLDGQENLETLSVEGVAIHEAALNKVPGLTRTRLRIDGMSEREIAKAKARLQAHIQATNDTHAEQPLALGSRPLSLIELPPEADEFMLDAAEMRRRYKTAFEFITAVNVAAEAQSQHHVVGTVGTFEKTEDGQIILGLDVRGIDTATRELALEHIQACVDQLQQRTPIQLSDPLPGSGEPVVMDQDLVRIAREVIDEHALGDATTLFSAAGHDAQNAARAGIPTVMLFCPSRDGIAHNPDAYTSPDQLERGVKALAALALRLAQ